MAIKPCPVLYISTTAALGGAELSLLQFLRHIDRERFPPAVVLPRDADGPLREALEQEGISPHHAPMAPLTRRGGALRLVSSLIRLRRAGHAVTAVARRCRARIIHANTTRAALQATFRPGRLRNGLRRTRHGKNPPVLLWHNRDLALPYLVGKRLAGKARAAIAVSHSVAVPMRRFLEEDRLAVIHSGVELEPFAKTLSKAEARALLGLPMAAPLILAVGQLAPWKNHSLFLQALARLRKRLPDAYGVIAGDTPQALYIPLKDIDTSDPRLRLRQLAARLGLEAGFEINRFPYEEMPLVYAAADVFLHLAEHEPFGRAVVEAMASGLPVVAVRGGGPEEALAEGGGCLIDPGDIDTACAAIMHYLQDEAANNECSQQGRKAAERYSAETCAAQIMALYARLGQDNPA